MALLREVLLLVSAGGKGSSVLRGPEAHVTAELAALDG